MYISPIMATTKNGSMTHGIIASQLHIMTATEYSAIDCERHRTKQYAVTLDLTDKYSE